jgi:hypothetical protein
MGYVKEYGGKEELEPAVLKKPRSLHSPQCSKTDKNYFTENMHNLNTRSYNFPTSYNSLSVTVIKLK